MNTENFISKSHIIRNNNVYLDKSSLIKDIFLSNKTYYFSSGGFSDIIEMIDLFKIKGFRRLILQNHLEIHFDPFSVALPEASSVFIKNKSGCKHKFKFIFIRPHNREKWIEEKIRLKIIQNFNSTFFKKHGNFIINSIKGLDNTNPNFIHIKNQINYCIDDIKKDLEILKLCIIKNLNKKINLHLLYINIDNIGNGEIEFSSNLNMLVNSDHEAHQIIQRAISDISSINSSICYRKYFNAISEYNEYHVDLINKKYQNILLLNSIPTSNSNFSNAIVNLANLPDFSTIKYIDIKKLIALKKSNKYTDIINRLSTAKTNNDINDIRAEINSISSKLASIYKNPVTKMLRTFVPTIMGLSSNNIVQTAVTILGVTDSLLIDTMIKENKMHSFIKKEIPNLISY